MSAPRSSGVTLSRRKSTSTSLVSHSDLIPVSPHSLCSKQCMPRQADHWSGQTVCAAAGGASMLTCTCSGSTSCDVQVLRVCMCMICARRRVHRSVQLLKQFECDEGAVHNRAPPQAHTSLPACSLPGNAWLFATPTAVQVLSKFATAAQVLRPCIASRRQHPPNHKAFVCTLRRLCI